MASTRRNASWHPTPEAMETVGGCGPLRSTGPFSKGAGRCSAPADGALAALTSGGATSSMFWGKGVDKVLCEICPLRNVTLFFFKSGTNKITLQAQLGS